MRTELYHICMRLLSSVERSFRQIEFRHGFWLILDNEWPKYDWTIFLKFHLINHMDFNSSSVYRRNVLWCGQDRKWRSVITYKSEVYDNYVMSYARPYMVLVNPKIKSGLIDTETILSLSCNEIIRILTSEIVQGPIIARWLLVTDLQIRSFLPIYINCQPPQTHYPELWMGEIIIVIKFIPRKG